MQKLIAWLKLFPILLEVVPRLEESIPLPAAGQQKLQLLLAIIKTAYDTEEALRKEFPWEKLAGIVAGAVKAIVDSFNSLGLFPHQPAGKP